MDNSEDIGRRSFLVRTVPACAVGCLAIRASVAGAAQAGAPQGPAAKHPFDEEMPRKFTYRQVMQGALLSSRHVQFMQFLTRTLGRERSLELLTAFATEDSARSGRAAARQPGGNGFETFKKMFTPERFHGQVIMEVVQSTDKVHELKVTECLWAKVCRDANAAEEGYASICHGDFAFAPAFNPQIEMIRDKTVMQGHPICNHRWVLRS